MYCLFLNYCFCATFGKLKLVNKKTMYFNIFGTFAIANAIILSCKDREEFESMPRLLQDMFLSDVQPQADDGASTITTTWPSPRGEPMPQPGSTGPAAHIESVVNIARRSMRKVLGDMDHGKVSSLNEYMKSQNHGADAAMIDVVQEVLDDHSQPQAAVPSPEAEMSEADCGDRDDSGIVAQEEHSTEETDCDCAARTYYFILFNDIVQFSFLVTLGGATSHVWQSPPASHRRQFLYYRRRLQRWTAAPYL